MRDRQGCLAGLLELLALNALFDWLQRQFGFGKGCSCSGIGCGFVLLCIFLYFACSILTGTDWLKLW
jgi:hypothetical protein